MLRLLSLVGGRATQFLFGGVFIGLLLPDLAAWARPLLAPSVCLMLLLTLLRVEWRFVVHHLGRPVLTAGAIIWTLLLSPLLVWAALLPFALPAALATALVLMASAPPIIGAVSIALFLGLSAELALVIGLATTLLAPFTVPPLALGLLGLDLDFSILAFMGRLGLLVGLAFLGAALLRRWLGAEEIRARAVQIDGAIVLLMLVFAVAIMDGVSETIGTRPGTVLVWVAAAFVANPLLQGLGGLCFAAAGKRPALTLGLLSGNRNMGLIFAALPPGADRDVLLFFALAQLPMYMLPAIAKPVYRMLLAREPTP
jgi:BASS family bile acid:Na+ symporter